MSKTHLLDKETILREVTFKAVRSSGAGGQHVNKVASKVELHFDIASSVALAENEKERLLFKLQHRLTKAGVLIMQCDEARSQHQNKNRVVKRFFEVLKKGLYVPKKRKPTKPSKSTIEKRLSSKKKLSDKKSNRRKPDLD